MATFGFDLYNFIWPHHVNFYYGCILIWHIMRPLLQISDHLDWHYLLVLHIPVEDWRGGIWRPWGTTSGGSFRFVHPFPGNYSILLQEERTNLDLVIDILFSFLLLAAFMDCSIQFGSLLRGSLGAHTMWPLFTVSARRDSPGQCRLRSILERALYQNGSEL